MDGGACWAIVHGVAKSRTRLHFHFNLLTEIINSLYSSVGKESACKTGDTGLIPGLGRSAGEEIGYPLQYSGLENFMDCIVHGVAKSRTRLSDFHFHFWASLVAQLVKNLSAMQETWVQSLGWEDPLEKGKATHSSILAWRISWTV